MDFYNDPLPWTPSRNCYPTNDDVVRYYLSRVTKKHHVKNVTIRQLSEFVRGIWEEGDGCPLSSNAIGTKFEKLFQIYQKYRKGEGRGVQQLGHKKKKTDCPPGQPLRRSSRLQGKGHEYSSAKAVPSSAAMDLESQNQQQPDESVKHQGTPSVSLKRILPPNPWKNEWIEDYGCQLFDVKSKV